MVAIGHLFDHWQDAPYITVWRYLERSCAGERQCRAGDDIDDVDARIAPEGEHDLSPSFAV